jgi:eukaryotic-like serine/threonine-protein kinase
MAQAFDARKLRMTGDPFPVTEHVRRFSGSRLAVSHFSVSENGVLAYRGAVSSTAQLAWYSRNGSLLGRVGEAADYSNLMISPDQKRVAVSIRDPQTKTRDIWVIDLQTGASSRLTFDPGDDVNPTWSPDGTRIAFSSDRNGRHDIYVKAATGAGDEQVLLRSSEDKFVEDWSPDGHYLAFGGDPGESLFSLRDKKRAPLPVLEKNFNAQLRFSPARGSKPRWFAYTSSESGQVEVRSFADALSGSEGKWQISRNGGSEPVWRTDGKELFYASGDKLMALQVNSAAESFEGGLPKKLFEAPLRSEGRSNYAVSPDGKRFLMNVLLEDKNSREMKVMLNWPAGLDK